MATVSTSVYPAYTNIASIKNYWVEEIAPNYFDFTNTNNYNVGTFGYINEVMGNTTEDAFNSVAITRREFYPVTAQFISSFYAMATLQSISIPLTVPSTCRAILIIPQKDIIDNSTPNENGQYECVIDDCLKIYAGDLQFMLDYPIKILSRRTDRWTHTVHYDVSARNSLNATNGTRYISNKIIRDGGTYYVALFIDCIRQLTMVEKEQTVVKDTVLDTVTMDVDFDGNLANFEVFYKENTNTDELQLTKVMVNAATPSTPYVQYELINQQKIRLIFTYNSIWYPVFNSQIIVRIYTSEGANGNFNQFTEDIVCSSNSEKYPYNSNMTIIGRISGSATGGSDQLLTEEFRNKVVKAYATNQTISTERDLQFFFDDISDDINGVKILFKKKRDDVFIRLFGAYSVFKDEGENIIPTNTLEMELQRSNIADLTESMTKLTIPAGTIFAYKSGYTVGPVLDDNHKIINLVDLLRRTSDDGTMYFATPFLMVINTTPNSCGYYMTSTNDVLPIEYTYINDGSMQQFIASNMEVYRNALAGNNFYRIRIKVTPTDTSNIAYFMNENDETSPENQIRATSNGIVTSEEYYHDTALGQGYIRFTLEYDDGTMQYIQGSNTCAITKTYRTGYEMKFAVGESFSEGDIIAVKRCDDLRTIMVVADFGQSLYGVDNGAYIPMAIQGVDQETDAIILEGYIATKDEISTQETIAFVHGIYNSAGNEVDSVAVSMKNQGLRMNILYYDSETNITEHEYRGFEGLNRFTLTNTYISSDDKPFDLVTSLLYVRSTVKFYPSNVSDPDSNTDYKIVIDEAPFLGAFWAANVDQFNYFVNQYMLTYEVLNKAYLSLNNAFNIDTKFYNTYGKSKFFEVGNAGSMQQLDSVRCKFKFGVKLSTVSNVEEFLDRFRAFVQNYIETVERITTDGQDLYIMNMIAAIRSEFEEILFLEYYGFNSYDHMAQKVVGPDLTEYQDEFIPEFLNLNILTDRNGNKYPDISVNIL